MKLYLKDQISPTDVPAQFYQARKKLGDERVNMPRGVIGPILNDEYSDTYFALYALKSKDLPHRELVIEAETIRQRLLHVNGVEKVSILGEQDQKIYVEISYQKLATLGITTSELFRALQLQNDVTPSGFVETNGPRVYLRLDGPHDSVETVKNIPIAAGGRILKISDITKVVCGYLDPVTFSIRHQGESALMLGVVMKPSFNGLTLGKLLEVEDASIQRALPLGMTLEKVSDQAKVIEEAIDEFMLKFFVALVVVMIVSLVTLDFRVGIVVAAAVPLTLAGVFVVMLLTGRDFDRIMLGALILSLGLLVDDAIIAIEMMVVKMEEGMDRVHAATFAWTSTAGPMLFGTLVTIVGFLPVGFARSTAGEYAGNIFWVVAFSLIISWFVAVIFTPYLGVKLLPNIKPVAGGHDVIYSTLLYNRFRTWVRWVFDHKHLTAFVTIAMFFVAVVCMGFVSKQFFPNSDRPEIVVEVNLPQGSAFATTEATVKRIEDTIRNEPQAKIISSYVGQGMPRFILSTNPELRNPAFAQIIVMTDGPKDREILKVKIRQIIADGAFPEARVRVKQFVFGPPVTFPVLFRVVGRDLSEIRRIAQEVKDIMAANPNLRDVHLDWGERTPTQHLVFDQDRLRLIGLTPQEVGLQLQAVLDGVPATQMREGIRSVDVVLRSPTRERCNLSDLKNIIIVTKDGRSVPVSQVAKLENGMEDSMLKRYDREYYVAVQGDVIDGVQPPDVTDQLLPKLQAIKEKLPAGYRIDTGGAIEESMKANKALAVLFPSMIILMLIFIMLQVRSFPTMFMVFATAPLGLIGTAPTLLMC